MVARTRGPGIQACESNLHRLQTLQCVSFQAGSESDNHTKLTEEGTTTSVCPCRARPVCISVRCGKFEKIVICVSPSSSVHTLTRANTNKPAAAICSNVLFLLLQRLRAAPGGFLHVYWFTKLGIHDAPVRRHSDTAFDITLNK